MTCPHPEDLLAHALAPAEAARDARRARHIEGCPACQARVAELREVAQVLRAAARPNEGRVGDCLNDGAIAALVEGRLAGDGRAAAMAHLLACGRCRSVVAAVARLAADPAVRAAAAEPRRRWRITVGLAAAAAMALFLLWPGSLDRRSESPHREPTITTAVAPLPITPIGAVATVRLLEWTAVSEADRYRITLFDQQGRVLWETESPDTAVAVPDSVRFGRGAPSFWKVEARTGFDRWVASDLVEFTVIGDAPP